MLVSVAMLLGAAVMCLVLVLSDAPGALAVGVVLAALPVGPVIACFLWLDRYEPEPVRLLVLGLRLGRGGRDRRRAGAPELDQAVLGTPDTLVAGTVVAPVTEEAAKGLFILLLLWRRRVIDGVLDGLVYAGLVGVGFAFTENILYLGSAYMGGRRRAGRPRRGDRPVRRTRHLQPVRAPAVHLLHRRRGRRRRRHPAPRCGGSSRRFWGTSRR